MKTRATRKGGGKSKFRKKGEFHRGGKKSFLELEKNGPWKEKSPFYFERENEKIWTRKKGEAIVDLKKRDRPGDASP